MIKSSRGTGLDESRLNARVQVATGFNTGTIGEPLLAMMKLIFETVFGRRIGTVDDGTSKSTQPNQPNPALLQERKDLEETKRSLQESTGLSGIFEGTTPMRSGGGSQQTKHGAY